METDRNYVTDRWFWSDELKLWQRIT